MIMSYLLLTTTGLRTFYATHCCNILQTVLRLFIVVKTVESMNNLITTSVYSRNIKLGKGNIQLLKREPVIISLI